MAYRKAGATDTITNAAVTQFPAGWWVTCYSDTDTLGETVAHRMSDRDAYYLLYRIGQALQSDQPVSLAKVRRVVSSARREIREDRMDEAWLVWAYGSVMAEPLVTLPSMAVSYAP